MTKTVYAYAADGKYLGARTLDDTDRSPLSGAWQIPGNMTEVKPPSTVKEGYDLYYRSSKWEQIARPKPPLNPQPQEETEPQEPYIDEERLALYEALAAQESRLVAQDTRIAKLKGGEGK